MLPLLSTVSSGTRRHCTVCCTRTRSAFFFAIFGCASLSRHVPVDMYRKAFSACSRKSRSVPPNRPRALETKSGTPVDLKAAAARGPAAASSRTHARPEYCASLLRVGVSRGVCECRAAGSVSGHVMVLLNIEFFMVVSRNGRK